MPNVLVDTGVWIELYAPRNHAGDHGRTPEEVARVQARLEPLTAVIPWPAAYEALRTRFVANRPALEAFERRLKGPRVEFVDDSPYRDDALQLCFETGVRRGRPLSMIDCLMRLILEDVNTKIPLLATFNVRDFSDVCRKRGIEILA